jgi:hypothetical protein
MPAVIDLLQCFVPIREQEVEPVVYSFSALFTVSLCTSSSNTLLHILWPSAALTCPTLLSSCHLCNHPQHNHFQHASKPAFHTYTQLQG